MEHEPQGSVHTFLFADMRGYTQFTMEHGDAAAARLVMRFVELARVVVGARGGSILELRGDEILGLFVSTRQALLAAAEMQGRFAQASLDDPSLPLRVGIGLDAGEALPVEGGYRGAALNLAARLCSLAGPGEVLTTEAVTHLAGKVDGLSYVERGEAQLKGFAEPVCVMRVLPEAEYGAVVDPVAVPEGANEALPEQQLPIGSFLGALPTSVLVARHGEMHQMLAAIDAVVGGEGRAMLLAGEPGAGKTRLAQEVSLRARNGSFIIGAGRCYEPEQTVPYYPFLDAVSAFYAAAAASIRQDAGSRWPYLGILLPDEIGIPDGLGGSEQDEQRVLRAVTSFVAAVAATRPVALLLDDLHWADSASIKLLLHLTRHTRGLPILIVGTYRDTEVSSRHPLEGALRDLRREGLIERIEVRRLSLEGTAALAADAIGRPKLTDEFVELLHRRTEGNPYFVQQVVRMLVERGDIFCQDGEWTRRAIEEIEVPESVRSVVGQRLAHLGETAQEVLHEASVLGQSFHFDDLLAMGQRSDTEIDDALEESGAAGLTAASDEGEVYTFDHALTRQTLYESLPPRRRRRLHLAAGAALERLPVRERTARVAEIAWHFLHADDVDRAMRYSLEAGDRAEAMFAHSDAERQYRVALELATEESDEPRMAEIPRKLGRTLRLGGRYGEALKYLEQAAERYAQLGDREAELAAVAEIGRVHAERGTSDEGINHVLPFVEDLEREGIDELSPACAASLYVGLAALYFRGGRWQALVPAAEEASRLAAASGDNRLLAEAEKERGRALSLVGRVEAAQEALATASKLAEKVGDLSTLQGALNSLGYLHRRAGELQAAAKSYRQALDVAERLGDPGVLAFARFVLGRTLLERGEWVEAGEQFERSLADARTAGSSWYTTYAQAGLGVLALRRGDRERGLHFLNEAVDLAERNEDVQGFLLHAHLARQEVLDGQAEDAVARLQRIRERTRQAGREIYQWELVWALLEAGNIEGAAELARNVGEHMLFEGRLEMADMLRVSGMVAARQGHAHEAAGYLEQGLTLARQIGMPYQEALLLLEYGQLQQEMGSQENACTALTKALTIFQHLGAQPYVGRCEQAIHALDTT